ncbi:complex I subunit 4 family protein [Paludibaculum fermentans]|uniref:NADH-quinone oxidoreductase subunit M n=1 Tax=Paludibaculum fermentans TaxID=1473598 RepID=A0A7S7NJS3_PALFE|nr:NADH-quinone oxidoreductase subunit M [Paludibaculum fermentans]QOY84918.1 NADH-quinone oxidoreductase subunit M [Paludibaculum fermentans]
MDHLLSLVLCIPLLGLIPLFFLPSSNPKLIKLWANFVFLVGFLATLPLWFQFDWRADYQFVEKVPWIKSIGAYWNLGVDGYAMLLVILTALIGFLSVLCSWSAINDRLKEYYGWFMMLQFGMLGVFAARDFLLFFVFWELTLIPMYFIIAIWGGQRRGYASIKFVIYTLAGSVLMLLGILAFYWQQYVQFHRLTFDMSALLETKMPPEMAWWVFWAFFLGFAVKVPMWPLHTWLPDAHTEAPTAGSVILAGILLKMGTYGFIRFSLPMLPETARDPKVLGIVVALSIIAIIYGALVSLMQKDWKKLVAYSSVSHMGFCTLGIFALNPAGIAGSIIQQINHGVSTGMLFLIVGVVYERRHTREIAEYGGLFRVMPIFTFIFLIAALSSMGLPPMNGFIGEITIIKGAFEMSFWWALACGIGIALGAAYLLWLFQRTMLGELKNEKNKHLKDLNWREIAYFTPLLILVFWIGLGPRPFFRVISRSVANVVERVRPGYYFDHNMYNPLLPQEVQIDKHPDF